MVQKAKSLKNRWFLNVFQVSAICSSMSSWTPFFIQSGTDFGVKIHEKNIPKPIKKRIRKLNRFFGVWGAPGSILGSILDPRMNKAKIDDFSSPGARMDPKTSPRPPQDPPGPPKTPPRLIFLQFWNTFSMFSS